MNPQNNSTAPKPASAAKKSTTKSVSYMKMFRDRLTSLKSTVATALPNFVYFIEMLFTMLSIYAACALTGLLFFQRYTTIYISTTLPPLIFNFSLYPFIIAALGFALASINHFYSIYLSKD
jgi:hypothetical protein